MWDAIPRGKAVVVITLVTELVITVEHIIMPQILLSSADEGWQKHWPIDEYTTYQITYRHW